jgi:phosphate transport system ATP-binding protein
MNSTKSAIALHQVSLMYSGQPVIRNLNAIFPRFAITALLGPSGSGKSTLLRALCRMNDRIRGFHLQGEVRILGQNIYEKGVDVYQLRRQVGLVFQKPCVFPRSILENVIFGLKHHAPHRKKEFNDLAEQALVRAFLWDEVKDRLQAPAPTLSQGQQQRLAIARTLAIDPEILLMDEPTASLDPKSTEAIEHLIQSLKARHTLVWVTHNHEQARRVADGIYRMEDSQWVLRNTEAPASKA